MQLSHSRPVVSAVFDEPNLVSAAGLVPVMGLAQRAGAHAAVQHGLRAQIQPPQHDGGVGDDDESQQKRARLGAAHGGVHGGLGGLGKARGLAVFCREGLHHGHGALHLAGHGAGVGHAVLAGA